MYQNVITTAGKSFSVVTWPWFYKWKTIGLSIWRLELIISKIKIARPSLFNWHRFFRFYFSVFFYVLVPIETIYKMLFDHISKHLKVRETNFTRRCPFNSLSFGVWEMRSNKSASRIWWIFGVYCRKVFVLESCHLQRQPFKAHL